MKIGILSINMYSKGLNFACPLHSYAFQQFLTKNGIDNVVVDYKPVYYDNFDLEHPYDYYAERLEKCQKKLETPGVDKAALKKKIEHYKSKAKAWQPLYQEREVRYKKLQDFIDSRYVKTDVCYDSDLLEIQDPGCDGYICATDVIWKKQPNAGFDRGYFLGSSGMENKAKIAYAASRGVYFADSAKDEELFFYYLKDFDAIGVREASLKNYIEQNSDISTTQVLDPVLLHEKEFYDDIIVKPEEEKYLFLYYVMEKAEETIKYAVEYARAHNLKIVEVTDMPEKGGRLNKYKDIEHIYRYDIGIEEWLGYFKHAECIFTNSFHACCFSILFQKDFYVGFRHGDKVTNVIETFGLQERLLANIKDVAKNPLPPIDYNKIGEILVQKREASREFILSAIRDCEGKKKEKDYSEYKKQITYPLFYNSKLKKMPITWTFNETEGKINKLSSGSYEYNLESEIVNDGTYKVVKSGFALENYKLRGWYIRIKIDNRWFWYLADGSLVDKKEYKKSIHGARYVVKNGGTIPYIPVNRISNMVVEAVWKKTLLAEEYSEEAKLANKGEIIEETVLRKVMKKIKRFLK